MFPYRTYRSTSASSTWAAGLTGASAVVATATGFGEAVAIGSAVVVAGDVVKNIYRGDVARDDIRNSGNVGLQTAAG